ncbi:hypothetical protein M5X17_13335 [Paenibacillus alvei]|uniref:Uncharacterized protein n=1 Tax=Paenibacillus alvei TaxID=44250 RepID=A0ABT4GWQ0_PAEAL|nr:hypothetical protein [Paenibacillus alvei]EJW19766.1 hypothetical protein PAV_1c07530 [Paenibacillus alvei DSM 29]MCY9541772.1 hypothetical protein [Paenibacillus alvei]MCY9705041.1 hypothetical protein [Paenibacillus alvei]MCY9734717.1 hypothetical protein [Paenibacillus alvei]MCY9761138.1 hypothetical protein [Paenibacillus alvei]
MLQRIASIVIIFTLFLSTLPSAYADKETALQTSNNGCGCSTKLSKDSLEAVKQTTKLNHIQILSPVESLVFFEKHIKNNETFRTFTSKQHVNIENTQEIKVIQTEKKGLINYTFSIPTSNKNTEISGKTNEQGKIEEMQYVKLEDVNIDDSENIKFRIIDLQDKTSEISLKELTSLKIEVANKFGLINDDEMSTADVNWKKLACSLTGSLACPTACLVFVELPPVMAACNIGCKGAWQAGLCSKA